MTADSEERSRIVYVDRALWQQLGEATTRADFCRAWLALQCSMLSEDRDSVGSAVVVLGEAEVGPFAPVATWPEDIRPSSAVTELAEECLSHREPAILPNAAGGYSIAYPLLLDGRIYGVVALALRGSTHESRDVIRQLQWGSAWLDAFLRREQGREDAQTNQRLMTALDLIATALSEDRFLDAARALATELATLLECDRASVGVRKGKHVRVAAMSHSTAVGGRMGLLRKIGAAMDEACDRHDVLVAPAVGDEAWSVNLEQRTLAAAMDGGAVLSVPIEGSEGSFGALTLERSGGRAFELADIELCRSVAMAVASVLEIKHERDRPWPARAARGARRRLAALVGPRRPLAKLAACAALALVVFASLVSGEYRITANSAVEGAVRRVIAAPIDGYLTTADARPGDTVRSGDVLAAFDDRDLRLERLQVAAEEAQLQARLQEAVANRERAEAQVIRAQLAQSAAHLELLDEQLFRARVAAPFDAVVVSGDMSQSLGAPIERGETLFELAPLDAYRVVLRLDEHDIAAVQPGAGGTLVLSALPNESLPIVVERITPIATAEEGINYFRVEAALTDVNARIRPGMEGVAKVAAGRERLMWIWTHKLVRWLRLRTWAWLP